MADGKRNGKATTAKRKRKRGRPRSGDQLDVRWDDVDKRYVFGEIRVWKDGRTALYYPSQRELARRHGVHHATVGNWARKTDAAARRKKTRSEYAPAELWDLARKAGRITVDEGATAPESLFPLEDGTYRPVLGVPDVQKATPSGNGEGVTVDMLPQGEIERILVHGEPRQLPDGAWSFHYPGAAELAERYNTSESSIRWIMKRANVFERREQVQTMVRAGVDEAGAALRIDTETKARARVVSIVDRWLDKFEAALDDGAITATSVADLERLVKLREQLVDAQRQQVREEGEITLRELEQRHLNAVHRVGELPPEVCGVVKD